MHAGIDRLSRLSLVLSAGALLAGLAAGCASNSESQAHSHDMPMGDAAPVDLSLMDDTPIAGNSATLRVEGLSCPACATNVDHQLMDVPGVHHAEVNLGDGTVLVLLGGADRPSRADLARAIHDSGFTLRGIDVP